MDIYKKKIEELRIKMYEAYRNDPSGQRVIAISRQLDCLINRVQKSDESSEEKLFC